MTEVFIEVPPPSGPTNVSLLQTIDTTTRLNEWEHRSFVEARLVTNEPIAVYHEYQNTFTLTGAVEDFDLEVDYPCELQRIYIRFNKSFEKTFKVDFYGSSRSNANIMDYSNHNNQTYEDTVKRIFLYTQFLRISFPYAIPSIAYNTFDVSVVIKELTQYVEPTVTM